jgi:cytochrome c-type biogenesis protein CcsB
VNDPQLASTSTTLFNAALVTYIVAMVATFFRLAYTRVRPAGVLASPTTVGTRVGYAATALTVAGAALHAGSIGTRWAAAGRVPWANMYEYSSIVAFLAIVAGLALVQGKFGYGHLMGFVLFPAILMMVVATMLYTEPGPVQPALDTYWIKIHTAGAMTASSIFMVAFAATALYLVKDIAERRVAGSSTAFGGSTVGAASVAGTLERPEGFVGEEPLDQVEASPAAQREVLSPVLFPVVPAVVTAAFVMLVWRSPIGALAAGSVMALAGIATWYAVPYLPPAAKLDALAYRTTAFAFPIWTFAVLAGAVWAEEAWGRYWGWDPKETGSFFTWVIYAAYLHARSTRGWRGQRAAWVAVGGFAALMVTYFMVNLWIVGLHSYAGV